MHNLGSFSAGNQNAQQALQEAIMARSSGTSPVPQLSQNSQSQPAMPPPTPTTQATPQGMPQPPQSPVMPQQDPEAVLIEKALASRLSAISSLEKSEREGLSAPVGGA